MQLVTAAPPLAQHRAVRWKASAPSFLWRENELDRASNDPPFLGAARGSGFSLTCLRAVMRSGILRMCGDVKSRCYQGHPTPETCRRIFPGLLPSDSFLAIFAIPWLVDISLWPSLFTWRSLLCVFSFSSLHAYPLCVQSSPFYKDQSFWSRAHFDDLILTW